MNILQRMAITALLTSASFSASAVPVFYNDLTNFLDSAGGAGALGFESYETVPDTFAPVYTFDGFSVQEIQGINAVTNTNINPFFDAVITDGNTAIFYDDNDQSLGRFFQFSADVNAFGLFVTTELNSTVAISGDGFSTSIDLLANTPTFFGVIDTAVASFAPITFDASGGPFLFVGFDQTYFGTAAVPEPAILSLLGFGLLLMGFRRHRA